jgi:hypothetical protein
MEAQMAAAAPPGTQFDKYQRRVLNNRVIAIVVILSGALIGLGALTGSLGTTWEFVESRVFGRSPALRSEYCTLLRPLMTELDRTKAAFNRWNRRDLSLESETIRDGNLKARALLRDKGHLVPDSLREHQQKLIQHYDQWLEEYDRVRVRRTSDPSQPFVFVFSFPGESERAFRERMREVEQQLGAGARCE